MVSHPTSFDDHDPLAQRILTVLEDFIDEIGSRGCTGHFSKVLNGPYYLKGRPLIQHPERFIEDHLVYPLLEDALGYSLRPRPKQYAPRWPRSGIPDFCVTSLPIPAAMNHDLRFFGEVKPPKKIENAEHDMQNYLDSDLDVHAIAILTDGFDWQLWLRPKDHATATLENPYATASLKPALAQVQTRNLTVDSYRAHDARQRIDTTDFANFHLQNTLQTIYNEFDIDLRRFSP